MILDAEYIRSILHYNPEAGVFTWKSRPLEHFKHSWAMNTWNSQWSGKEAGCSRKDGYWLLGINRKIYLGHRIAWLYMMGEWPSQDIDHIDMNKSNLRWSNLRLASVSQNAYNQKLKSNNTSGHKGVYWSKAAKKWQAYISVNKESIYLGVHDSIEAALSARTDASLKYHGEFARVA